MDSFANTSVVQILSHLPYLANTQGLLSNGHTFLVLVHLWIQCRWNPWLQVPQAVTHSWFGWLMELGAQSMHGSIKWFLQIAHCSTSMSHDQNATAFHFLTSNRLRSGFPVVGAITGTLVSPSTGASITRQSPCSNSRARSLGSKH